MAEQQIYHGLVELQQHLRLFFFRYQWPSASILVSGIDRWVIAMWCHWLLSLHGFYQPAPIAVWAKCHKNSLSYVVFVFVFAILIDLSPLQLKALFTFEFIPLVRVLSIHPFQALYLYLYFYLWCLFFCVWSWYYFVFVYLCRLPLSVFTSRWIGEHNGSFLLWLWSTLYFFVFLYFCIGVLLHLCICVLVCSRLCRLPLSEGGLASSTLAPPGGTLQAGPVWTKPLLGGQHFLLSLNHKNTKFLRLKRGKSSLLALGEIFFWAVRRFEPPQLGGWSSSMNSFSLQTAQKVGRTKWRESTGPSERVSNQLTKRLFTK